jgi:ornithine--oxo-acid transaminase
MSKYLLPYKNNNLSNNLIKTEKLFAAHNYHPIPVVYAKAKGCYVWDPEGKKYLDFLGGYAVVNQGHRHPKIISATKKQLGLLTTSCRAFYNDKFPLFAEYMTKTFNYDMILPMNTGAEAVETGIKLARRWGYEKKGISEDDAIVIAMENNFHGRTTLCVSLSTDKNSYGNYGPRVPGIIKIPYNNTQALDQVLTKYGKKTCAVIVEPVQGEAGVIIPERGYLTSVRKLCNKHNVLWIDDEVQAGLGRCGTLLSVYRENVRPDVVLLAKALGGGVIPVSCVLADKEFMGVFTPGTHGSTFGGSPLASAVGIASVKTLIEEKMPENAAKLQPIFNAQLQKIKQKHSDIVKDVRCIGLWGAIEFDKKIMEGNFANKLSYLCKDNGLLCKTTHGNILRLSPPLILNEKQLETGIDIIDTCISDLKKN